MLPSHAAIVIIGGGAVGCSIAYHLAKAGASDVVLLEKSGLTHGATWHAAGLVGQLRSKRNLTRMMQYSVELYGRLTAETGVEIDWRPAGSLRIASSKDRWSEFKRLATTGKSFGFELQLMSDREAVDACPIIARDGIEGAVFVPGDGYVDPSGLTQAYARGSRSGGVRIVENVRVTGFKLHGRRVAAVVTDQGTIQCETAVNAAGMWAQAISKMAGARVPAVAVEHQYMVSEKSPEVPKNLPTLRDPDKAFYLKPDVGALVIGGWEQGTAPFMPQGVSFDFGRELLPSNFDRFEKILLPAAERLPILDRLGVRTLINGPIPISPDGEPIMGLAPELDNFYVACGFTSGIAASGGAGKVMAEWILHGRPQLDLWPFDIRRFGHHHMSSRYQYERAIEAYHRYYCIHWPVEEMATGRGGRRSPLYPLLKAKGAVFGSRFGWERANWFAPPGVEPRDVPSFEGRPSWFESVAAEHRAVRERAALIDMSSFSKFEITGPGTLAALQRIAANDLARPVGSLIYTQLCNEQGGIEADLTFMRTGEQEFYCVTGSGFGVRDGGWIRQHLPQDGSVGLRDVTSERAVINIAGPRSREVLAQVTDSDLSNDGFPYMSMREIRIGYAPVRAARVTYVGELGWELHVPMEYAAHIYELLWEAGRPHGIADAGYRAVESCRLEKRYLYWSADLSPDYNPYEAGLGFCVALEKGEFIGRAALARVKAEGVKRRLCVFLLDEPLPCYGGEAILHDGKLLGVTTSGGYGHTLAKSIAFGYLPMEDARHAEYEIEAFGRTSRARRIDGAPYDPQRSRILA
jgi:4-methylaminobutanoate oxidase (formaldehyde-forming)